MAQSRKMSISVPEDMAEFVQQKVASGEYASDSEVIRDGLRILRARDSAVERWLREDVARAYDAMKERGEPGLTPSQLRQSLAARVKAREA